MGFEKKGFTVKLDIFEKIGSVGTFIVASACPVCWPLFIPIGSALGLGFLQPYEGIMMNYVFPLLVVITLIGSYLGYRIHRTFVPLAVTGVSVALILIGFYGGWHLVLMYIGIIGVLVGSVLGFMAKKKCNIPTVKQGL